MLQANWHAGSERRKWSDAKSAKRVRSRFLVLWTLSSALGLTLAELQTHIDPTLGFWAGGVILGLWQWVAFRSSGMHAPFWVSATTLSWYVGFALAFAAFFPSVLGLAWLDYGLLAQIDRSLSYRELFVRLTLPLLGVATGLSAGFAPALIQGVALPLVPEGVPGPARVADADRHPTSILWWRATRVVGPLRRFGRRCTRQWQHRRPLSNAWLIANVVGGGIVGGVITSDLFKDLPLALGGLVIATAGAAYGAVTGWALIGVLPVSPRSQSSALVIEATHPLHPRSRSGPSS